MITLKDFLDCASNLMTVRIVDADTDEGELIAEGLATRLEKSLQTEKMNVGYFDVTGNGIVVYVTGETTR